MIQVNLIWKHLRFQKFQLVQLVRRLLCLHSALRRVPKADGLRNLSYITRGATPPGVLTQEQNLICNAPHDGPYYDAENRTVHQKLRTWLTKANISSVNEHVREFELNHNGHSDVEALKAHFDGLGEIAKQFARADGTDKALHYKNENGLAFRTFTTQC
mmetsp:Transcript_31960/g.48303  ORF Transcript_31960/g.48303 Transcript_31960/m.48303 type:complete len:159 (-) Transcript_31960:623-1099(-)